MTPFYTKRLDAILEDLDPSLSKERKKEQIRAFAEEMNDPISEEDVEEYLDQKDREGKLDPR